MVTRLTALRTNEKEMTIRAEIEALRSMTVGRLRERYAEVFGDAHILIAFLAYSLQVTLKRGARVGGTKWEGTCRGSAECRTLKQFRQRK